MDPEHQVHTEEEVSSASAVGQGQEPQAQEGHERQNVVEEIAIDPVRQLQEAMARMIETQAKYFEMQLTQPLPIEKPLVDSSTILYKNFKGMDPPTFTGTKGEEDAENWMKRMKQIFRIMDVTDKEKLKLATFMLTEEAYHWWESTERILIAIPTGIVAAPPVVTWANFEEAFNEKYFSEYYQSEKRREFLLLEQGSMSTADYVTKFTALSRFAPTMVSTEKARCEKFQMGLNSRIQPRVSLFEEHDFKKLVSKSKIAERDIEKADGRREQFKKSRNDNQPQQKGQGNKSVGWGGQSSQPIRSSPSQYTRSSFDRG
jgi:hypothetical protein